MRQARGDEVGGVVRRGEGHPVIQAHRAEVNGIRRAQTDAEVFAVVPSEVVVGDLKGQFELRFTDAVVRRNGPGARRVRVGLRGTVDANAVKVPDLRTVRFS